MRGGGGGMAGLLPFPPSQPNYNSPLGFTSQDEMWHFGFKKHERHCLPQL